MITFVRHFCYLFTVKYKKYEIYRIKLSTVFCVAIS